MEERLSYSEHRPSGRFRLSQNAHVRSDDKMKMATKIRRDQWRNCECLMKGGGGGYKNKTRS